MLIPRFMRFFFNLLYHPFAFTYDLVAATVSLGHWKDWVHGVLPFIEGTRILEVGHGPGHLQRLLRDRGLAAIGLDESAPMGTLAKARLRKSGHSEINLTRGITQNLPFPDGTFDTIVSTFPSEYIFDPRTLTEARRCLASGGRLVVLPVAFHIGQRALERLMAWLFRVTGQTPHPIEIIRKHILAFFENSGFEVEVETVEIASSLLVVAVARKQNNSLQDLE